MLLETSVDNLLLSTFCALQLYCIATKNVPGMYIPRTVDVKCLRNGGIPQNLVFFEILIEQLGLFPIEAIFTVPTLAPTAAIYHTSSVRCVLFAVGALVLWTVEMHLSLRFRFKRPV